MDVHMRAGEAETISVGEQMGDELRGGFAAFVRSPLFTTGLGPWTQDSIRIKLNIRKIT